MFDALLIILVSPTHFLITCNSSAKFSIANLNAAKSRAVKLSIFPIYFIFLLTYDAIANYHRNKKQKHCKKMPKVHFIVNLHVIQFKTHPNILCSVNPNVNKFKHAFDMDNVYCYNTP